MYFPDEGTIDIPHFLEYVRLNKSSFDIKRTNKKISVYNIPAGLDIETSSFYDNEGEKASTMYAWGFGIYNKVTVGRTWREFENLISGIQDILELGEKKHLYVYVHNLPYEFQFIRKRFEWERVFLLEDRKPVYCSTNGVVFKCSLKLSGGRSLDAVSRNLVKYKVRKMVGDLDYSLIRHSGTPLTDAEIKYLENDVRVILYYIQEKIEQDGDITLIPLTNTSYVRNYCRKAVYKRWKKYRKFISNLCIEPDEYMKLRSAFQGGFTHANPKYVLDVLKNVFSCDLTSSYPSVMVLEQFPMGVYKKLASCTESELISFSKSYCCLFKIKLASVVPRLFQDNPISSSKCIELKNPIIDNGRISMCDYLEMYITEQDYYVIREFYDYDSIEICDITLYYKGYLPKDLVLSILKLYEDKTLLKNVDGMENEYMISKNMINSAFGMMVTNPLRDIIEYIDNTYVKKNGDVAEEIERYNKNVRRFLYYPWGVWVTSYARANLFSAIIELGSDYIYSDTDSVKFFNMDRHKDYFRRYNEGIERKIKFVSEYRGIDINLFAPMSRGKSYTIGVWDYEGEYDLFKTLGAKRYLIKKGGEVKITMAGVNKGKVSKWLGTLDNPFDIFNDGTIISKDVSGRIILTYIDDEIEGGIVDYTGIPGHYKELSCIHMAPSDYEIGLSGDFIAFLRGIKEDPE